MLNTDTSSVLRCGVSIAELSTTAWQVRGRGGTGGEVTVLLGFIQHFGDVFEAMDVTRPLERTYVPSMAGAVASITGGSFTQ